MRPRAYIETTIVSYLTARPSRDLVTAANQQTTREWWDEHHAEFDLYSSQVVTDESSAGDPSAARKRLDVLEDIPELDVTEQAILLAEELMAHLPLPQRAELDVLHIAVATIHGMDYLLTWNCTHIANATLRAPIQAICRSMGYEPPIICTPQELMEE